MELSHPQHSFPLKNGKSFFYKTLFMVDKPFLENLWEIIPHRGLVIRSCQDGVSQMHVSVKILPNHGKPKP